MSGLRRRRRGKETHFPFSRYLGRPSFSPSPTHAMVVLGGECNELSQIAFHFPAADADDTTFSFFSPLLLFFPLMRQNWPAEAVAEDEIRHLFPPPFFSSCVFFGWLRVVAAAAALLGGSHPQRERERRKKKRKAKGAESQVVIISAEDDIETHTRLAQ